MIVPVRDRPDLLRDCLAGLTAQDLDPRRYEIVVCDDGSREDVASVVAGFQSGAVCVRLLRQQPRGPAAARNLGIRNSRAPLVVFVDSDVQPDRQAVGRLAAALESNPHWLGAEATVEPTGGEDNPLWDAPTARGRRYLTAGIAYRRQALEAASGFDEAFDRPACEDVELAVRVLQRGEIGYVPESLIMHPRRRITLAALWRRRTFWRSTLWLAVRYGFLAWPERPTKHPRLRTALAAVATLPLGHAREAARRLSSTPAVALQALGYAAFDVLCGVAALPQIVFGRVPERRDYLNGGHVQPGDDPSPHLSVGVRADSHPPICEPRS